MIIPLIVEGEADSERKSCYDCHWCQGVVNWWCVNKEAQEYRRSNIPDAHNCTYWKAAAHIRDVPWYKRMLVDYLKIKIEK